MNKFESILTYITAGIGAAAVALEAAAKQGLVKADSPVISKGLGWASIGLALLQTFAALKANPSAIAAPAPAPAAPVAPAAA
jgi:hypothetical protein